MKNKNSSYKTGRWAELLARFYMRAKGYSILQKNYITGRGTHAGEIDFIAKRGLQIVFIEVKKRADLESAAYSITPSQITRIQRGAEVFIKKNPQYQNHNFRFDAILVRLPFTIQHIKNAF